ncbi:uncharacterized protein LOC144442917 [Glandiceps talaboti]
MSLPVFLQNFTDENAAIQAFWHAGYSSYHIKMLLEIYHDTYLSSRQLKYRMKKLNLVRTTRSSDEDVDNAILHELNGSGSKCGYRAMWCRLKKKYKLNVSRDSVATKLRILDPDGVQARGKKRFKRGLYRSICVTVLDGDFLAQYMFSLKGPNQVWHLDGYDKLKPYGICISGCIDGYSRKIMWVKAASTNNNPAVIAHYYLACIKEVNGCPLQMRADPGTENETVAAMQMYIRQLGNDPHSGERSFIYGKSCANQRIEAFWSYLLRAWTEWWRQHFSGLVHEGLFVNRSQIHKCLIRHCYLPVIQTELDDIISEWNDHSIRRQSQLAVPCGRPNLLYYCPELSGGVDCLQEIPFNIDELDDYTCLPNYVGDSEVEVYLDDIMKEDKLLPARSPAEAQLLYERILERLVPHL